MDIEQVQPSGSKRSLTDSSLTLSAPPSPIKPNGNLNIISVPQNLENPQKENTEEKKKE